jgi:acetate kinase
METAKTSILIINSGSSSIKFSLYKINDLTKQLLHGELENTGVKTVKFHFTNKITNQINSIDLESSSHDDAVNFLIDWLEKQNDLFSISAIGHRKQLRLNY